MNLGSRKHGFNPVRGTGVLHPNNKSGATEDAASGSYMVSLHIQDPGRYQCIQKGLTFTTKGAVMSTDVQIC